MLFFALFRVKSVFLHAMANNTAALGLYHSFGFHEVSIVARFYQLRTENSATASSSDGSSSSSSSSSSLQEQPGGVGPALVLPWSRGSTPSTSMPEPAFADALLLSLDLDSWASSRPPPPSATWDLKPLDVLSKLFGRSALEAWRGREGSRWSGCGGAMLIIRPRQPRLAYTQHRAATLAGWMQRARVHMCH